MRGLKELQDKLSLIDATANEDKNKLMYRYAMDNAKYGIGDTIEDNCNIITIEKLKWFAGGRFSNEPQAVYYGSLLTKKLKPRKDNQKSTIYDSNVKSKLEKGEWVV